MALTTIELRKGENMVVETKRFVASEKRWVSNYFGLSTDERPTGHINGSKYHEIDTGKVFMYDETNDEWHLQPSSGGGDVESMFIHAESHTTKETYVVPVLTDEQIVTIYNGVVAGNNVFIVDDLDTITIQVLDASSIDPDVSVVALFRDKLILTYQVGEEVVATPINKEVQKATSISDNPSDDKFPTEKALYNYIASGNLGKPRAIDNVDLDTVLATGFYSCNVCTHRPTENNGVMLVIKNAAASDHAIQVYWTFIADVMWVRHRDHGTWKAWTKVLVPADIEGKQNSTDNTLATLAKTIVGAINEVNSIAKGANQAVSFDSYSDMVTALNSYGADKFVTGQNIYVVTQGVPDLWVSEIDDTSVPYTYVDDDTLVQALIDDGYVQIGYYAVSMLETQKVDLTNYVQKEEGKGLSEEDFTSEEKAKLEDIEEGAEKNDPNTVIDSNYVHTDNNFDNTAKSKLAGIEAGAEVSHDLVTRRYEGVDLAVKFASEIAEHTNISQWIKWRCQQNKLNDLFPHDYFTITFKNGKVLKVEIAGIDQYLHNGDTEITKHHIDWIVKDCWDVAIQYNKVNYNNGIGLDKFTGDGAETTFQLTHRANGNFPTLSKVTVGGTDVSNYSYDVTTGQLVFDEAPTGVIKAIWTDPVNVPFLGSNLFAYLNSLKMGVPNEAAADPLLTEVDYTQDGIWYNLPDELKEVIVDKRYYTGFRYTQGTLRTSDNSGGWVNLGKIWVPDEIEVYGHPVWANYQYTIMFGRQYPCFKNGNRTKGNGNNGSRIYWWLLPAYSGTSTSCTGVDYIGNAYYYTASNTYIRAAFGFRISA